MSGLDLLERSHGCENLGGGSQNRIPVRRGRIHLGNHISGVVLSGGFESSQRGALCVGSVRSGHLAAAPVRTQRLSAALTNVDPSTRPHRCLPRRGRIEQGKAPPMSLKPFAKPLAAVG